MHSKRINTITELQAEQDRLVGNMRIIRKELTRSAEVTGSKGRDFLLQNVLLPVGAIGLGAFVAKTLTDRVSAQDTHFGKVETAAEENGSSWFPKLMLVALPLVQQYFVTAEAAESENASATTDETHNDVQASGSGVANWLPTFLLMAIPMLEQFFLKKVANESEHSIKLDVDGNEVLEGIIANRKSMATVIFESLYQLLPVVLPLVQQYFATGNLQQEESKDNDVYAKNGKHAQVVV